MGRNAVLELDFAIARNGKVDPTHAARYKEFGDWIRACYSSPVANTTGEGRVVTLTLSPAQQAVAVDRVWVREDIAQGERIRAYEVDVLYVGSTQWVQLSNGTSVGNKKIDFAGQLQHVQQIRLNVTDAAAPPVIADFAVFAPCPWS